MTSWSLFVDESGNFGKASDGVIVAGLLIETRLMEEEGNSLREFLQRYFPYLPWPLHFAYLGIPVLHALGAAAMMAGNPNTHLPKGLEHWALQAVNALKNANPQVAKQVLECLEQLASNSYPDFNVLKRLDKALRRSDQRLHEQLRNLANTHVKMQLLGYLHELQRQFGASSNNTPLSPMQLVAASEIPRGWLYNDRLHRDPHHPEREQASRRYEDVLLSALQRVADLMGVAGGEHQVSLHIATRRGPTGVMVNVPYLRALCQRVVCRTGVSLEVAAAPDFDDRVPPFIVLADYLCLNLRRPLTKVSRQDDPEHDLMNLNGWVGRIAAFDVLTNEPQQVSRVSAAGEPDRLVHLTRGSADFAWAQPPVNNWYFPAGTEKWCAEQARKWARTLV